MFFVIFFVFVVFFFFFFVFFFVCLFVSASPTISGKKIGIKKKLYSYQVKKLKKKKGKKKSRVYSASDAMGRTAVVYGQSYEFDTLASLGNCQATVYTYKSTYME